MLPVAPVACAPEPAECLAEQQLRAVVGAREVVLRRALRPREAPSLDVFETRDVTLPSSLAEGSVLVRAIYVSVDPYLHQYSLRQATEQGKRVQSRGVGVVVASRAAEFPVGCAVYGSLGWSTHSVVAPAADTVVCMADGAHRGIACSFLRTRPRPRLGPPSCSSRDRDHHAWTAAAGSRHHPSVYPNP